MCCGRPEEARGGVSGLLFPTYAVQLTLEQNGFDCASPLK